MDAFHRCRERESGCAFATTRFRGGQAENRSQPLAPSEEAVAHGAVNRGWLSGSGREEALQGAIDLALAGGEVLLQRHQAEL